MTTPGPKKKLPHVQKMITPGPKDDYPRTKQPMLEKCLRAPYANVCIFIFFTLVEKGTGPDRFCLRDADKTTCLGLPPH